MPGFERAGLSRAEAEALVRRSVTLAREVRDELAAGRSCAGWSPRRSGRTARCWPTARSTAGATASARPGSATSTCPGSSCWPRAGPDLLAVETIPDLDEAAVLVDLLDELRRPGLAVATPAPATPPGPGSRSPRRSRWRRQHRGRRRRGQLLRPRGRAPGAGAASRVSGTARGGLPELRSGLGQRHPLLAGPDGVRRAARAGLGRSGCDVRRRLLRGRTGGHRSADGRASAMSYARGRVYPWTQREERHVRGQQTMSGFSVDDPEAARGILRGHPGPAGGGR